MSNERERYTLALATLVNGSELGYEDVSSIPQYKKDIEDYVDSLEKVNKKYKEVIHKGIEYIKIYRSYKKIDNKDYLKGRDEIGCLDIYQVDELLDILKEVE